MQKEKKKQYLQQMKEAKEMEDENLTFKPQINRKGPGVSRQG